MWQKEVHMHDGPWKGWLINLKNLWKTLKKTLTDEDPKEQSSEELEAKRQFAEWQMKERMTNGDFL